MAAILRAVVTPASLAKSLTAAACAVCAFGAHAAAFEMVYTGTFNSMDALNLSSAATPGFFTSATPYTITAFFDTSTTNLAPSFGGPFGGFRAYLPSSVTFSVAGKAFSLQTVVADPTNDITVAIFDQNSFTPGHYGIGLLANPVADGAGIVGDFLSASTDFTAGAITPTTFTGYAGVGFGSGVCIAGTGTSPACDHVVTPWTLHDASNTAYTLTFGNYEEDYPTAVSPAINGPLNTAQLLAVPEPGTCALMLAGLVGVAGLARKRGVRTGSLAV